MAQPRPAAWSEDLFQVVDVRVGALETEGLKKLHRLGENPAVATLTPDVGEPVRVAVASEPPRRLDTAHQSTLTTAN